MKPKRKIKFDLDRVDVIDMFEALDLENVSKATEEEANFSCPFPDHAHGDKHPSAYMNLETTAWMCQGCKRRGNAATFLAEFGQISTMEAIEFLRQRYGGTSPDPDSYSIRDEVLRRRKQRARTKPSEREVVLDEEMLDQYEVDWEKLFIKGDPPEWAKYIFDRGFSPQTLENWGLGYCSKYERITIPVRDELGQLVGFKGRAWSEKRKPKYIVMGSGEYERYHVSRVVFGLDRIVHAEELIIVEGELDTIALDQMGISDRVGVNGSNFSSRQARLIRSKADSALVFLDTGQAGFDGTELICNHLRDHMRVRVAPDHKFDPARALELGAEDSVRETLYAAITETKARLLYGREHVKIPG